LKGDTDFTRAGEGCLLGLLEITFLLQIIESFVMCREMLLELCRMFTLRIPDFPC
jgi:hypothetical protein